MHREGSVIASRNEDQNHRLFFWIGGGQPWKTLVDDHKVVTIKLWPAFALRPDVPFIADQIADEIRAIQPAGPYLLGGDCLTGLIAYDVARRLVAGGQEVPLLVMVNPWMPGLDSLPRRLAQRLLLSIHHPATVIPFVFQRLKELARRFGRTLWKRPERVAELTNEQRAVNEFSRMRTRAVAKAFENYVMRPYPGRVTCIVGNCDHERYLARAAWACFARGGVELHVIPGAHIDIGESRELPLKISECLEKLVAGHSTGDGRGAGSYQSVAAAETPNSALGVAQVGGR